MTSPSNEPTFWIIGGPNGVGKSTFAATVILGIPYINGDEIKRQAKLQGHRVDTFGLRTVIQAQVHYFIRERLSFAMESNLVSNFSFETVIDLSSKGYATNLYYIGASDLGVLNQRIQKRVKQGLHYVSPADVQQRYAEALSKLPSNLKYFDNVIFLDNSINGAAPEEVLHMQRGIITWKHQLVPSWLNQILPFIERLSSAYEKLSQSKGPSLTI